MTIPPTIPRSAIDFGERGRTTYSGIEDLADSIQSHGLIQPIVLQSYDSPAGPDVMDGIVTRYALVAGGRRLTACDFLGVTKFHHGLSCEKGKAGFLLKTEEPTPLSSLLCEIAENRSREDVDWRDEVKMLVRGAKLLQSQSFEHGQGLILLRDLGELLGVGYQDIRCALAIHSDLIADPESYKDCSNVRVAVTRQLEKSRKFLEAEAVKRQQANRGQSVPSLIQYNTTGPIDFLPIPIKHDEEGIARVVIPLSSRLFLGDSLTWMSEHLASVDHIICDPDFAVRVERLESNSDRMAEGVASENISDSLNVLYETISLAWTTLKQQGFFVFFYDLDHHEKLKEQAELVGFAVQRWPLIWHKTDYNSNAAPTHNLTKNFEYAMFCRKPGTVLAQGAVKSLFACPTGNVTKTLGHPFAKPADLWTYIFRACCLKGQTTFDPFMGRGSSILPAIDYGLVPLGCEIQEQHYNGAVLNVQQKYRTLLGEGVRFE